MEATLTSSTRSEAKKPLEAVIVSGERRGEMVTLNTQTLEIVELSNEMQLSPQEEKALDFAVESAQNMAASAVALTEEMRALNHDLKEVNRRLRGRT